MQIAHFHIPGPVLVTPRRFGDARGWFCATWNRAALREDGLDWPDFVQDNPSYSAPKHTLRGLHYQRPPHAQDKLMRASREVILDVSVDARKGAPTYDQHVAVELSAESGAQLYVPKGFLYGFFALTEDCETQYKCTDIYTLDCDGGMRWDSTGIDWGITAPVLSEKDARAIPFAEFDTPFTHEGAP